MKKYTYYSVLFIFLLGLIPLFDLFHVGLPITHDGQDHVARIANFYQNLAEGNIIPRWAANLNWGYGHPILMFLYPLPSYMASFFHFVGFSLVDSVKIVFGVSFIASSFTMYLWIREFLGIEAGIVSAAIYLFAPYRFVDLYVRGAIGEHVAFIFPPLICYFLLKISNKYSYWNIVGGVFSVAGLILSHNAITIMFLPLIFLYILYLLSISSSKKYLILNTLYIILLGFGLSSFFLLPAFFEGKYTLRDIVTTGQYKTSFSEFKSFLYGDWSYGGTGQFTVQVGIIQWLVVLLTILYVPILKIKKDKKWTIGLGALGIFFVTIFLMMSYSNIVWKTFTLLQKFQFPWRFLSVTVFISAFCGGVVIYGLPKKVRMAAVFFVFFLCLFLNKDYWHAKGYLQKNESFFTDIYNGTTDTGESAPIWSIRFMEHRPKALAEVIDGKGSIVSNKHTITKHLYDVIATSDKLRMLDNTLYFPGWSVSVDGMPTSIEFQDQRYRGLMTFYVPKGLHTARIVFSETKLRLLSDFVSFFSLVILLVWGILQKVRLWPRFQLF